MQALHLAPGTLGEVGVDPAGQHRVHLDVVLRPRGRAGAGKLHDAALARRVSGRKARREDRHHRTDIDDLAAARLLHVRIGGVRADERAGEVGIDHAVPFGDAERIRGLPDVDAGIVHQNVEATMPLGDAVDQRPAGLLVCHIHIGECSFATRAPDLLHGGRALGGVAPCEHDGRAGRRHSLSHAEPDAAIAAGDDRDAAGKIEQAHPRFPPINKPHPEVRATKAGECRWPSFETGASRPPQDEVRSLEHRARRCYWKGP